MAMWEGARDSFDSKESAGIVKRYKEMLSEDQVGFFDVSDFEYLADHYIEKNQLTNALQVCNIAISQHPHALSVKIKKAQVLLGQLKLDKAFDLLSVLVIIEKTNPDVLLMFGNCYQLMGEQDKAFEYFCKAEEFCYDDRDELLYNIGVGYLQDNNFKKAIYFLQNAFKENKNNESVIYDLAYCYDKLGNDDTSILFYNKYLDLDPFSESAWYNLGIIYTRREEYEKAIESYDFALAIDENYSSALFNKANALSSAERFGEALECYLNYLKFDQSSSDAHVYIAECYFQLEQYSQSYHYYKQAIHFDSQNPDGWYGAGIVLMIEEKLDESLVFIKKAIKLDGECSDYWNAFGKVNASLNRYEEARLAFKKSIELEDTNIDSWIAFSEFYYHYKQSTLAIQTLLKAELIIEDSALMYYKLSGYLAEEGDTRRSKIYLSKALSINFQMHNDLFIDFPKLKSKRWIKNLINLFAPDYTL